MATITDTIKQYIDELEIERHVTEASERAEETVGRAIERAGGYAYEHTEDLETWLDKAGSTIDERTDGRYTETWTSVRGAITSAWGKLADRRALGEPVAQLPTASDDADEE